MTGYIPSSTEETRELLAALGADNLPDWLGIPQETRMRAPLDLPQGISELELMAKIKLLGAKNTRYDTVLRGAGAYRHFIPAVVDWVTAQDEFLTAYTPYQAELSQGLLCAIFEYQTQMCALTGMYASNASLYDGAYALAEAVMMCRDARKKKVLLSAAIHPHYLEVVRSYCAPAGFVFETVPAKEGRTDADALKAMLTPDTACAVIQSPNYLGLTEDTAALGSIIKSSGTNYILSQNPLALALYTTPAEAGADIVCGEAQPFGMPLSFGGPYLGYLCCGQKHLRNMGGRVVGETKDRNQNRAFVLTLQAREQHIRRENAKSSICSNQALCALRASVYLDAMGPEGLKEVAASCRKNALYLKAELAKTGLFKPRFGGEHFHEFATTCPENFDQIEAYLRTNGILCGLPVKWEGEGLVLWCATELTGKDVADHVVQLVKEAVK